MTSTLHLSQVKLTPRHLERKAVIYIRQSSPKQVRDHLDSQLTQRALVDRAQSLGWHADRIEVFDGDLGQSATGGQEREDFKALAAEVALGHVGVVFGWQVSRLARNNAEWYQIIYHPQSGWFEDTPLKGGTEAGYPLKGVEERTSLVRLRSVRGTTTALL